MTELELEAFCDRHPNCDCNCIKCVGFVAYQREELGFNDKDEESDEDL